MFRLKRDADGRFDDGELPIRATDPLKFVVLTGYTVSLAKILQDATESYASAFKARGIPEALRVVEMMSIEQGRKWGTCSVCLFMGFVFGKNSV